MKSHRRDGFGRRDFLKASLAVAGAPTVVAAATGIAASGAGEASAAAAPPPPASAATASAAVDAVSEAILRISREVWATPELSLEEEKSAEVHLRELRAAGFTIVSTGTSGTPTAFVAEWTQGTGGPKIGFLPEYDALPGLGNAAEPRETAGPTGVAVGHGCGHNLLGAGCTGAAFALKRMMMDTGAPGTVRVFGCAAEETQGVKVYMARDGLFDDMDACLAWHPAPITATGLLRTAAADIVRIDFYGRTAHAGVAPWEGRSAQKAAEMFGIGVNFMREHIEPTSRLHYVYPRMGEAANVVPDRAQALIMIRDADRDRVVAMTAWVRQIAEAAAMATQTRAEVDHFFGLHDLMPNETLAAQINRHLNAVGLEWTEEEQAFARACQAASGLPEKGLATDILPMLPEITTGGGTDVGDVSYNTPTGLFGWTTMPLGVGLHTWPVTACGGMSIGDKASLDAARVMAGVGYDLMTDADLRAAARADFNRRRGDRPYVSPIPPDRKRPDGIPEHLLLRDGTGEFVDQLYRTEYVYR